MMAAPEEEPMSELQRSLLRRLNTLHKPPEEKPGAGASKVSRQKTFSGGSPSGGGGRGSTVPRSFTEELQMKRNAVVHKRAEGRGSQPERNVGGNDQPEQKVGVHSFGREKTGAPPPPPASRRKVAPRPSDDQKRGVATPNAANGSTGGGGGGVSSKAAGIISKLETRTEKKQIQNFKPGKFDKSVHAGAPENKVAGRAGIATPGEVPHDNVEPVTAEPTYVNIEQIRDEMSAHSGAESKPQPDNTEVPPKAPERGKSFRTPRNISTVPAGADSRSHGVHSGSNSGASGDGVVVHNRKAKASNRVGSETREVVPMGSSSESDYSGDGKVQRMRQREKVRRGSNTSGPPPLPQHPPPMDHPPPLPQNPPPQHLPPQIEPPQLPPPRRQQQPADYEESGKATPLTRKPSLLSSPSPFRSPPPVKLQDFLSSHAHQLPAQLKIKDGILGEQSISAGKTLNLHFMRNVQVATIRDPDSQSEYMIPCNSNIKLGLIYNPSPYDESASPYMQLKTVADIMKLQQLPTIVTATMSHNGGSPEKSVTEGEILFVKGTAKGGSTLTRGKVLHMVNALGEDKHLSLKCSGSFSTDPRHTKTHLSILLQHDIQWPQYIVLYPSDKDVLKNLPASMSNALVELESVSGRSSVIATPGDSGSMGGGGTTVLDISIDADMEVVTQDIAESSKQALARSTTQLHQTFKASRSQYIVERQPTKSLALQRLVYQKILDENTDGVLLYLPSKDGPPPAIFDLKVKKAGRDSAGVSVSGDGDNVSISPSILSTQDSEHMSAKPADTLSISSSVSGNVAVSGAVSHSESGMDLSDAGEFNAEIDDDEQAIYEDIEDICENLKKEVEMVAKGKSSEEMAKEAGKKSSLLSFLKGKKKGKKGKSEASEASDAYVDVEFGKDKSGGASSQPAPELIPTHSRSSSESYDAMGPGNTGYTSDNYEEYEFSAVPPGPAVVPPPVPALLETPSKNKPSPKLSLGVLPKTDAHSTESLDKLFKKNKGKIRASMKKGGTSTLPRKMKLGTSDVPPIPAVPPETALPPGGAITDISLSEQVWSLTNQVERLKVEIRELSSAVEALRSASGAPEPGNTMEANLKVLKDMTLDQVLKLLDSMDMSQYRASFTREQVTGIVLALVDDDILRLDLKVTSKLHRVRLLKIASGEVSVLSGKDSKYVKFTR